MAGRPRKVIDADQFKKLCGIQCTLAEIAGFFDCSEDTIEAWCKRELGMKFSEAFKKHSASGKISLRRNQFRLAEKNSNMAIWLGKVYLNQRGDEIALDADSLKRIGEILGGVNSVID